MDDDLTMLIGPAADGALLEIGVLDLEGEDPVVVHAMGLRPSPGVRGVIAHQRRSAGRRRSG